MAYTARDLLNQIYDATTNAINVLAGTGATDLGKAEDAAHASGDTGVQMLVVRNDALAALAGTDGDYSPLQVDAIGGLYVNTGSIAGPTVDSFSSAAINAAASTDQELVAAPGSGKQIWVYGCFMMADTGAGTVTFYDDADTVLSGVCAVSDEGGWVLPMSGNFAMPWIKVATNKALDIDCGTSTIDGIITYGIISV